MKGDTRSLDCSSCRAGVENQMKNADTEMVCEGLHS